MCNAVLHSIEDNFEGGVTSSVQELFKLIQKNAPKVKDLARSLNEPIPMNENVFASPSSVSSKYQEIVTRNSILTSRSSVMDETVMGDMDDYIDKDKAEIYQTVDDLITIIESQQTIKSAKTFSSYQTPDRSPIRGVFIDPRSPGPFNAPLTSIPLAPCQPAPDHLHILSNISEPLIKKIHAISKSHLSSILPSIININAISTTSPIQKLNSIKKAHSTLKSVLGSVLYLTQILNTSLIHLLSSTEQFYTNKLTRMSKMMSTLGYAYYFSNGVVIRHHQRTIQQIRAEADLKEKMDLKARLIQRSYRQYKQKQQIEQLRKSKELKIKAGKAKTKAVKGKLESTHGNTGKFLLNESKKQMQTLFDDLLHIFVFKQHGFAFGQEENM